MKTYCALGFGNNFFYPLGEDSLPVPSDLLPPDGDVSDVDGEEEEDLGIHDRDDGTTDGILVSLLPLNPDVVVVDDDVENVESEDGDGDDRRPPRGGGGRASSASASASDWLRSRRQRRDSARHFASGTIAPPTYSCGATHTSVILPAARGGRSNATAAAASSVVPSPSSGGGAAVGGDVLLVGTIFGRAHRTLTPMPTRLPLRVVRISSGRRHVLALTEGPGGGGGGVVMSWGAGHFGQLGHGPDVTSCPAPRAIERLLPHASGGTVVEIAAGGLHSAAIVALSSSSSSRNQYGGSASSNNGNNGATTIVVRETRTFAWGSNRKGQCGVEGGKCATVPEPLPVVAVKRGEMTSAGGGGVGPTTANGDAAHSNPVDRVVHFEKLSLGRLHTVALTAHGEVFTWGSTSMGRCGHNNGSSLDPPQSSSGPSGGGARERRRRRRRQAIRPAAQALVGAAERRDRVRRGRGGAHPRAVERGEGLRLGGRGGWSVRTGPRGQPLLAPGGARACVRSVGEGGGGLVDEDVVERWQGGGVGGRGGVVESLVLRRRRSRSPEVRQGRIREGVRVLLGGDHRQRGRIHVGVRQRIDDRSSHPVRGRVVPPAPDTDNRGESVLHRDGGEGVPRGR